MRKKFLKNQIKKIVFHNIGWKLLSIVLAMVLWFIVMNLINPTETKTYNVNISIINKDKLEESNFVILNENEIKQKKVEVKIRAARDALDALDKEENKKNISAVLDLSQFDANFVKNTENSINVAVTSSVPANLYSYTYQIISNNPSFIEIKLDNISKKSFPVTPEIVGTAAAGYVTSPPVINPKEVVVIGAESEIEKIDSVKVLLDISGAKSDIEKNLAPIILDSEGKEITKTLSLESPTVNISVLINKHGQLPIKQPETTGNPAAGYFIEAIDFEPKVVEVIGDESGISKISSIELPPINVEGISENKTIVFDVRPYLKDTGLSLKNDLNNEIHVTVKLNNSSQKTIEIPAERIALKGLGDNLNASVESGIQINIDGDESVINSINTASLGAEVNLSGFGEGTHSVEVTVSLPDKVKTDKKYYAVVIIKKSNTDNAREEIPTALETEIPQTETKEADKENGTTGTTEATGENVDVTESQGNTESTEQQ